MYYVIESPINLSVPISDVGLVKCIKANRDNMFIGVITSNYIMIWFSTTCMLIAFHQRADDSISIHGENYLIEWNNDSSKIVVMTTKGYLIYYKILFENEFVISDLSYSHSTWNDSLFFNKTQYHNPLLTCKITHDFSIHVQHANKCIYCFNDEIFIPLLNGKLIKVPWNDQARHDHFYLSLQKIFFKYETDGELFKLKENLFISEFELSVDYNYNCMAAVLSDGTAIYLVSDSANAFRGLMPKNTDKNLVYKCVAINPLYKIVAFGCKNGLAVAYHQPDDYTQLQVSNYYVQNSKDNENSNVIHLKWSPDYKALCVLYENGTFCIFSVFGSLLYESKDSLQFQNKNELLNFVKALDFGIEGFSLWLYMQPSDQSVTANTCLFRLKLLKSSALNNTYMNNVEHISLNGEREVYVCLNVAKSSSNYLKIDTNSTVATGVHKPHLHSSLKLGGNSTWQILNVPLTYISNNFPIRLSSIDSEGKHLAVAGVRGFTHFSFATRRWKMFGNAEQEKDIRLTCGLMWWKEFICMCCYNLVDQRDEIRFYSKNTNLDNNYSKISKTSCSILQVNIFNNLLILFGVDCRIQVMGLEGGRDSTSKIILNKLIEIQIDSYVFNNPYLVVSISLCPLYIGNYDETLKRTIESNSSTIKSILINVSGNLLMFQPDLDSLLSIPEDLNKTRPFSSLPPIIISSCVENYWVITNSTRTKLLNNLMNLSLWLNCGYNGIKVWLPLSGDDEEVKQANRIILTFPSNFYPLGLLINDSLLIGAGSEMINSNNCSYSQIQKTTQLYMPFILEGLIRKGMYLDAKKIALGYHYLPYFLHILELLIHKILEEEALSSDDSNRILPKVIEFINQFPDHLKIISHCTRKSEVAVWPYLFSIAGNSKDLFEKCLNLKDLETAASYLVVLQNTESSKSCEKLANMLLKDCLKNSEWNLVKEIMRFISSIDPADFENEVFDNQNESSQNCSKIEHQLSFRLNKSTSSNRTSSTSSLVSPSKKLTNNDSFGEKLNEERQKTPTANAPTSTTTTPITNKQNSQTQLQQQGKSLTKRVSLNEIELSKKSIESTIYEYAYELVRSYQVKKLFDMFSNLDFLNINKWLEQYQLVALVDSYVHALTSVHFDFDWPYPFLINEFKKTNSFVVDTESLKTEKNGNHHSNQSDFINDGNSGNGDEETTPIENGNSPKDVFDFHLVAQELANTGSLDSKNKLIYIIEKFIECKCYEWVFVLALVLQDFSILNELIIKLRSGNLPSQHLASLRVGLKELDEWSQNECCGYRKSIKKLINFK